MAVTTTTRLGVYRWSAGSDSVLRSHMDTSHAQLETLAAIYGQGTVGSRPAAGTAGRFYWATDTTLLYYDDGSAWRTVTGNMVDTSTVQSAIGGAKTFTALLTASAGVTVTGAKATLAATAAGYASLNLPHGTAPSSPVDGDVWTTTGGLYVRVNGATVGPLNTDGPASTVTTLNGLQTGVVGTSTLYARGDHQHAVAGVVDVTSVQSVGGAKTMSALLTAAAGLTVTGAKATLAATVSGYASLNLPHGSAPSAPADGDVWTTTAGLYVRVNGATVGPLNTGGPATSVTTLTGLQTGVVGTSTLYARQDHQHAVAGVVDTTTVQSVGGAKTFTALLTGSAGLTVTGAKATLAATAAGYASLNLPHGTAPSSPVDGDVWTTTAGFYVRVNGTTVGPIAAATNIPSPASTVTTLDGLQTGVVGTGTTYARDDHKHAVTNLVALTGTQTVGGAKTFTSLLTASAGLTVSGAKTTLAVGVSGYASLSLGAGGTAPSAPADGDVWKSASGLFYRDSTATRTVVNTDQTQTLTNKSISGATNTLSAIPSAAVTGLNTHTGASTGVHGVSGAVVGTTDSQTLASKTLTAPVINGTGAASDPKTITGDAGVSPTGMIAMFGGGTAPSGWLLCDGSTFSSTTYPALAAVVGNTYGTHSGSTYYLPNLKGKVPVGRDSGQTEFDVLGETGGSKSGVASHQHGYAHTHGTGNQSADHTHTFGTGGASADHAHYTSMGGGGHSHSTPGDRTAYGGGGLVASAWGTPTSTGGGDHSHAAWSSGHSADHSHSGTTNGMSASHTHSTTSQSTSTSDPTGTSSGNLPPYLVVNFIIKT